MAVGNEDQAVWQIQLSQLHTQVGTDTRRFSRSENELQLLYLFKGSGFIQRRADPVLPPADIRRMPGRATVAASPEKLRPLCVS